MGAVRNENFIVEHGWMINELGLKGNDLRIYAIIYGFSQTEGQRFTGGLQYLADWVSGTKQGVLKNLKTLLEKGYIEKQETIANGIKQCSYRATEFNGGVKQSLTGYSTEFNRGSSTEFNGGVKQSSPNNIPNTIPNKDIDIHNENNVGDKAPTTPPDKRTRFIPPTVEEVAAYCRERGNHVDAQRFYDFYTASGWKRGKTPIKDWRACVRTWERSDFRPQPQRPQDDRKRIKTTQEHSAGQHASGFGWGD